MKKSMLFLLLIACFAVVKAQVSEADKIIALDLVKKNKTVTGLSQHDIDNSIVTNSYVIPGTDIRMLYLQQRFQNIPVYNQLNVLAFKNDLMVSNTGSRIAVPEQRSNNAGNIPVITAEMAVQAAMTECNVKTTNRLIAESISPDGYKIKYGNLNVATENISAELIWFPVAEGNDLKRAAPRSRSTPRGRPAQPGARRTKRGATIVRHGSSSRRLLQGFGGRRGCVRSLHRQVAGDVLDLIMTERSLGSKEDRHARVAEQALRVLDVAVDEGACARRPDAGQIGPLVAAAAVELMALGAVAAIAARCLLAVRPAAPQLLDVGGERRDLLVEQADGRHRQGARRDRRRIAEVGLHPGAVAFRFPERKIRTDRTTSPLRAVAVLAVELAEEARALRHLGCGRHVSAHERRTRARDREPDDPGRCSEPERSRETAIERVPLAPTVPEREQEESHNSPARAGRL